MNGIRPMGLILSGGPNSVYEPGAPHLAPWVTQAGLPILGLCYGLQLLAHSLGGKVSPSREREYGAAAITVTGHHAGADNPLFAGLPASLQVWMSHGDRVESLPDGFKMTGQSPNSPLAAMEDPARRFYGVQFHPEVTHTLQGQAIMERFVHDICGCPSDWTPGNIVADSIARVREQVGDDHVILGLSGGVDSSVVAALLPLL